MSYQTPWSGPLEEGVYIVEMPSNVLVGDDTYNFGTWQDGDTNPVREVELISDITIDATFILQEPPPLGKGYLEVHAFVDSVEVVADGLIVEAGYAFQTDPANPVAIELDPGSYTVQLVYGEITRVYTSEVTEGDTIRLDAQLTSPVSPALPLWLKVGLIAAPAVGIVLLKLKRKK